MNSIAVTRQKQSVYFEGAHLDVPPVVLQGEDPVAHVDVPVELHVPQVPHFIHRPSHLMLSYLYHTIITFMIECSNQTVTKVTKLPGNRMETF